MKFYVLLVVFIIFLVNLCNCHSVASNPAKDFKPQINRKCNHQKRILKKNFLTSKYDRKLSNTYYTDIQFQNLRMHFDYTYTLPFEEDIIRELIMPPVKRFFENSLSIRRFPGKIRFPSNINSCQDVPIPQHLKEDGVDSDLLIIVSTYRGVKKYKYEQIFGQSNETHNSTVNNYVDNYFAKMKNKQGIITNSTNSSDKGNSSTPPWMVNDGPSDVIGWSVGCLQDIFTMRPLAGIMQYVADIQPTQRNIEEAVWTTLHEISHVLAFDHDLYSDFIDEEFNRLGLAKTVKIKSTLIGLQKLIDERKDLMNDYEAFVAFNSSNGKDKKLVKIKRLSQNITNNGTNNTNNSQSNITNSNKTQTNETNNSNNSQSNITYFSKTETNRTNLNNTGSTNNTSNITNITQIGSFIHLNNTNNSTNITSSNGTSFEDFWNNLMKQIPRITMDVGEVLNEITIPKHFNLTTLFLYITNFMENTKMYIITPKVIEYAKKHFGCDAIDGVELEHFGGLGSSFSHWSKRILNTEFMIADSYGENYISNFTLALFEDSGWYKVDYSKAEQMLWGKNKGCDFLENKCINKRVVSGGFLSSLGSDKSSKYDTHFKEEFCTNFEEEKCSISHTFRAICGVNQYITPIPKDYQYFSDPFLGGFTHFGDYCPYPIEWMDPQTYSPLGSCRNGINLRPKLGEKVCENCRCFQSNLVHERVFKKAQNKLKKNKTVSNLDSPRAACYESKCKVNKEGKVELVILIDDLEIKCPRGGAILSLEDYKGFIECPKVESVCTGSMDPHTDYTSTSAYNLFSNLNEKLLNLYIDYIKSKE